MRKKCNDYEYEIVIKEIDKYAYKIYEKITIESEECFDTKQEAEFAAIGYIDLLEKEGN